jgi:hypothetical protein
VSILNASKCIKNLKYITTSSFVYKARTQFKINFDHIFSLINYELHATKIISLETSFEYESNNINFMIYILFFVDKNWWSKLILRVFLVNKTGGSNYISSLLGETGGASNSINMN